MMNPLKLRDMIRERRLTTRDMVRLTGWSRRKYFTRKKSGEFPPLMVMGLETIPKTPGPKRKRRSKENDNE